MPLIYKEDNYDVVIRDPYFEEAGKDGEQKMALVLPGYCTLPPEDGGDPVEHHINAYLYFTPTLIGRGANAGRPVFELSHENACQVAGVDPKKTPPSALPDLLNGKEARFVVQSEEYEGKTRLRVAFVNSGGRKKLDKASVDNLWKTLNADAKALSGDGAAPASGDVAASGNDEIPF